jgi:hypothetical protein
VRRINLVCGSTLVALGALALVEALRVRDEWQGAKLMPAAVGVLLLLLGAVHPVVRAVDGAEWPDRASARRVGFVFGVLVLYVAVLPSLGFLPATALFVLTLLRALGAFSWSTAIALTAAIALTTHVVFRHWLGMPLPSGPFGL